MAKKTSLAAAQLAKISGNPGAVRQSFNLARNPDGSLMAVPRAGQEAEFATAYGILDIHRAFKNRRYLRKKNDPSYRGPIIVAEGDSWFEFPLADDLIMWLGQTYAIMSLAKAGDAWTDIQNQNELFPAIRKEKPDIVMLSVGGNEIMGNIERYVHSYKAGLGRDDYIRPNFAPLLGWVSRRYEVAIETILKINAKTKVIIHGYDYPNPREWMQGGQWIGGPLENFLYIGDHTLWRHVANSMIDQFNANQAAIAGKYGDSVHYVNLRGTIGRDDDEWLGPEDAWDDEIHGTSDGFHRLSKKLAAVIDQIAPKKPPMKARTTALSARAKTSAKKKRR